MANLINQQAFSNLPDSKITTKKPAAARPLTSQEVLQQLLLKVTPVNFQHRAGLADTKQKLQKKHWVVLSVAEILRLAQINEWGMCRNNGFIYIYNSKNWSALEADEIKTFLGKAAELMGVDKIDAQYFQFRDELYKQFLNIAHLPTPKFALGVVRINLQNGTFEISNQQVCLQPFRRENFLTYQLPFAYEPDATAPQFKAYLTRVLPDKERQQVLAEYLGYLFIHSSTLKLEKALLLYGSGANGKSVVFEIVNALLGVENVSSYSLQSLTNENGYFRAKLANKLVNYASEINGNLETAVFKQLVSGEPVEARLPYGEPFTLTNYAKLIFNCNQLPKDVEHTTAYFRRFLIVPFGETIPEEEQDKQLASKIIKNELSGVFNWVLQGLHRLLKNKQFSPCEAARQQLEIYKQESDTVHCFITDEQYKKTTDTTLKLTELYQEYTTYCKKSGCVSCSQRTFADRLRRAGYTLVKKMDGQAVHVQKNFCF